MPIPLIQVDAFTTRPFGGNPAAICPLEAWLPDETLLAIAAENNLSETAFLLPRAAPGQYDLRWFTPVGEVDLCGHATLASASVVLADASLTEVVFHTRSGPLTVRRGPFGFQMDFPAMPCRPTEAPPGLRAALGVDPVEVWQARDLVALLPDSAAVRALRPDFGAIAALGLYALTVTAPGDGEDADVDFVSRFFAPGHGIDEDPVTGSAHCTLAPFWAARLGRTRLRARQVSRRGGELRCELRGDRVILEGHAVRVLEGTLLI